MLPLDYFIFLQIILFLFITPGLPRIVIVSHSINYGLNRSVWTALGDISANFCQGILVVFVIGSLLKDNPDALTLLKWASVLYILYLAYDTFTTRLKPISKKSKKFKTRFSFYKDGFLVAGFSPKAIVFFGTIFTSFIDFNSNYYVQFLILIFTYITLDFLTLMIYGLAAEKVAKWLKGNPKTINTISACVLALIALFLAATSKF
jgi:homoserine/homoserine lactone efflux protein